MNELPDATGLLTEDQVKQRVLDNHGRPVVDTQPARSGTLLAILEGQQPEVLPPVDTNEIVAVDEREAEALRESVPADVIENVFAKRTQSGPRERREKPNRVSDINRAVDKVLPAKRNIVRGDVLLHKPTKRNVTVVKPDCGLTSKGEIKHRVMTRGLAHKFEVPESSLEDIP